MYDAHKLLRLCLCARASACVHARLRACARARVCVQTANTYMIMMEDIILSTGGLLHCIRLPDNYFCSLIGAIARMIV